MKKRLLAAVLCLAMLLALVPVSVMAYSPEIEASGFCGTGGSEDVSWQLYDNGTMYISGSGLMDGYEQGDAPWYGYCDAIKTVIIQDGVTSIGEYAFADCSSLTHAAIPESVTMINTCAFSCCSSLTSVRIPSGVTKLKNGIFDSCTSLEKVTLGDAIVLISDAAFYHCTSLLYVEYAGTAAQWENITIEEENTCIQDAFKSYGILSGTCGDDLIWKLDPVGRLWIEGTGTMDNFTAVSAPWQIYQDRIEYIEIYDGVTSIGTYAFLGCSSAKSVTIPDSVEAIGHYAFYECKKLTDVKIPDGITRIPAAAFCGCTSLEWIYIPASVVSIGDSAFYDTCSLSDVYYGGKEVQWNTVDIFKFDHTNSWIEAADKHYNVVDYDSCGEEGSSVTWMLDTYGTLTISGTGAMYNMYAGSHPWESEFDAIKRIVIEDGVTYIGSYSFPDCTNLTAVQLPVSAVRIGEDAFKGCTSLADVYYTGERDQWGAMKIYDGNAPLYAAKKHYQASMPLFSPFADVQNSADYYFEPVIWAEYQGIVYGTSDTTFSPMATCTRAQVVTFLYRAAGEPDVTGVENPFKDVKSGEYYYDAVLWGYQEGIVYGTSADKFSPNAKVTRAQFITFLHRFAHEPAATITTSTFVDVPADAYYIDAVLWGYEHEIVYGTAANKFSPNAFCTRGQVVTFLYRYLTK